MPGSSRTAPSAGRARLCTVQQMRSPACRSARTWAARSRSPRRGRTPADARSGRASCPATPSAARLPPTTAATAGTSVASSWPSSSARRRRPTAWSLPSSHRCRQPASNWRICSRRTGRAAACTPARLLRTCAARKTYEARKTCAARRTYVARRTCPTCAARSRTCASRWRNTAEKHATTRNSATMACCACERDDTPCSWSLARRQ
mmetsp:Transcript_5205/g.13430  ORF Transcript_5205/g.13430 Transcript_5205/m.13430 type:complete len:206 (+) Transcript_5205:1406-2023(+)